MPDGKTWMAENLNYDTADGTGSWCYYNNPDNCVKYGRLYNWNTAMTACPVGWRLPSNDEWGTLVVSINPSCGSTDEVCAEVGRKLKSKKGWRDNMGNDGSGTDEYDFSALPGGTRWRDGFINAGIDGSWWSATEFDASIAWIRGIGYRPDDPVFSSMGGKVYGNSVRCVRDD